MELIHSHRSNISINRERRCVGVDFSSPNIAKEMHVGHLRSTIIGDTTCRILEWLGDEVYRINHVGDWGTQFGMLITYLQEEYGNYTEAKAAGRLNFTLTELTGIYQASKKRFDDDENFKEQSRLNVVRLQSGEEDPRNWWAYLCDISRLGFSEIYGRLGIELEEMGESFYQEMIPSVIDMLSSKEEEREIVDERDEEGNVVSSHRGLVKLVEERDGALLIHCDNYDYPLFLRKSDGGFGYDSTDLAAIYHRTHNMKCDELIYITDAGQASHFNMIFDVAGRMNWNINPETQAEIRINHIGFGVVCGEDGKKFSTRAGKSVKLIDLLNESQSRIEQQLRERLNSTDSFVTSHVKEEDVPQLSADMGYAGIKYFDLK
jgi:arginyl-tRNA synthetase